MNNKNVREGLIFRYFLYLKVHAEITELLNVVLEEAFDITGNLNLDHLHLTTSHSSWQNNELDEEKRGKGRSQ